MRARLALALVALAVLTGVVNYLVTRPSAPPVETPTGDDCERGCRAAATCELAPKDCVARCRAEPALRACAVESKDCFAAARCFLALTCGDLRPSGTGSCLGALECVAACAPENLACACRCTTSAAANDTLKLARVSTCILNCDLDEKCVRSRCESVIRACALD